MRNEKVGKALRCLALALPEDVYNDAIPIIRAEIERLEHDIKCLRTNCFTMHEVEVAMKNATHALWEAKEKRVIASGRYHDDRAV